MIAPRHLIFTSDQALIDPRTGSTDDIGEALSELDRRKIALILVTQRTRAEIEPLRRELGHNHPFITENGGAIFFPDGYLNVRIPAVQRTGRYLSVHLGLPYDEVCTALDDIAEQSGVGVAGFHHMKPREIAENTGLDLRDAELARSREFDEPFFFTSSDPAAISKFMELSAEKGFVATQGDPFWHFSGGCDAARAVRSLSKLFREATRIKLRTVGIGSQAGDLPWLRATDHASLLPSPEISGLDRAARANIAVGEVPGAKGWNLDILNIIS